MATAIESEKLKIAAELASLRAAINVDVQAVANHGRDRVQRFSAWFRLPQRLLRVGAALLTWRAARKAPLSTTVTLLTTILSRSSVRSWLRERLEKMF